MLHIEQDIVLRLIIEDIIIPEDTIQIGQDIIKRQQVMKTMMMEQLIQILMINIKIIQRV